MSPWFGSPKPGGSGSVSDAEPPAPERALEDGVGERDFQAEADATIAAFSRGLVGPTAALALAVLVGRAATRLHNLARAETTAQKGGPEWVSWAALQNATRNVVLQSSTCRDLAAKLAGRRR